MTRRAPRRARYGGVLLGVVFLLPGGALSPGVLSSQERPVVSPVDTLSFSRPEAWAMARFTSVALPTGMGPLGRGAGVTAEGEVGWIPEVDEASRRVGFNGQKEEDMNKSPAFGRIRVAAPLPGRTHLTLGFVPPVELNGATPLLVSGSLARPVLRRGAWTVDGRVLALTGRIRGDFTCPASVVAAGSDLERNPYRCEEPSRDRVLQRAVGLEILGARGLGRWSPYLAVRAAHMELEFRVDARYAGIDDRARLRTRGTAVSWSGGVAWRPGPRWEAAAEVFHAPLAIRRPPDFARRDEGLVNARLILRRTLRPRPRTPSHPDPSP